MPSQDLLFPLLPKSGEVPKSKDTTLSVDKSHKKSRLCKKKEPLPIDKTKARKTSSEEDDAQRESDNEIDLFV